MLLLKDLIGNQQVVATLLKAVAKGQVAHAYLFAGPPGVGKETAAAAFSRALLCSSPRGGDACGTCRDCRLVAGGNHPDFHLVRPLGATFKIEQARSVQRTSALRPYRGKRKVFLLPQAESMTGEAANCLLKTLEEPPPAVVFILTSDRPHVLLPTIVSRCQQLFFRPLPAALLASVLVNKYGLAKEEAVLAAALAGGSLGKALEWAGGDLPQKRDAVLELAGKLASCGPYEALEMAGNVATSKGGREEAYFLLDVLALWYRDLLVWRETGEENLLYNSDRLAEAKAWGHQFELAYLVEIIEEIMAARSKLEANASPRLVWESLFLSLGGACKAS